LHEPDLISKIFKDIAQSGDASKSQPYIILKAT
jgi:hypothetical protein